ncbi:hypothetical protein [Clostridium sp.]|uniref:hypothetical protein n=1 Tax=Clostridium sp. TaxID=1506 RepID=UPI0039965D13
MNEYKKELEKELNKQICPECGCKEIGIDNWGMFYGKNDWFYFCKECDITFVGNVDKEFDEKIETKLKDIFKDSTVKTIE